MHHDNIQVYQHSHDFHEIKISNITKVFIVVVITLATMVAEIFFGWLYNSMALLADGWHMSTHAGALSITLFTYYMAHKRKTDSRYSFGTWKIEILGAYTSAILLGVVGFFVIYSSVERIMNPVKIQYDQALIVTIIGLIVNIICAFILNTGHHHDHGHAHVDDHHHHDLNIRSAYLHVLADALTSVLAIIALLGAKLLNLTILDPLMGIVGSILIFKWSFGLLKETSAILLDKDTNEGLAAEVRQSIETDNETKISDLHLWKIGQNKYSCIISLVADNPKTPLQYKQSLKDIHELGHVSIEVTHCT